MENFSIGSSAQASLQYGKLTILLALQSFLRSVAFNAIRNLHLALNFSTFLYKHVDNTYINNGINLRHISDESNSLFTLKVLHGGNIDLHTTPPVYLGGQIEFFKEDADEFGIIALTEKMEELGYSNLEELEFFSLSHHGLEKLATEKQVWSLTKDLGSRRMLEIWVVCRTTRKDDDYDFARNLGSVNQTGQFTGNCEWEWDIGLLGEHIIEENSILRDEYGGFEDFTLTDNALTTWHSTLEVPNFSDEGSINDSGSDSDKNEEKWPTFNASIDMQDPEFKLGMTFSTKEEFKEAMQNYAFKNGKDLRIEKNDKVRYIVQCKHMTCPWKINLRKVLGSLSWRILGYVSKHEGCSWTYHNKMVNSTKLAKRWVKEIKSHTSWKMKEFREKVCTEENFHVSNKQAYRAMEKAKKQIQGSDVENFNQIWRYCLEINKTNPGTTCCVKLSDLTDADGQNRFLRIYICWEACKMGFRHCRAIVGVDGTHLKSHIGGQLLTAIGYDANDSLFPLAYAIVEGETRDAWTWFLQLLKRDLGISGENENMFTFISDKQKGLLPAFKHVFPTVTHRYATMFHLF
ncbi:unnamed protein product [Cuscuta europaea]|uniref:Transposase MuDR plant domain-containing protein n=1 Tax=Cuscuta europaea TaxID=41803 RepID=A0A9P1EGV6_CUSEU|nr:unnamed protein product [Cuscuta europaea]